MSGPVRACVLSVVEIWFGGAGTHTNVTGRVRAPNHVREFTNPKRRIGCQKERPGFSLPTYACSRQSPWHTRSLSSVHSSYVRGTEALEAIRPSRSPSRKQARGQNFALSARNMGSDQAKCVPCCREGAPAAADDPQVAPQGSSWRLRGGRNSVAHGRRHRVPNLFKAGSMEKDGTMGRPNTMQELDQDLLTEVVANTLVVCRKHYGNVPEIPEPKGLKIILKAIFVT